MCQVARAEGNQERSSISLDLKRSMVLPCLADLLCLLTIWAACSSFCSMCSESLLLLFFWPWIPRSTDRASTLGNGVLDQFCTRRSSSGEELTPP